MNAEPGMGYPLKTKAAPSRGTALKGQAVQTDDTTTDVPRKWRRVLEALASGKSFNRFEAERQFNDHCLHSTVSTIQSLGVPVTRKFETVPGYRGLPTRVCRYNPTPEAREQAKDMLSRPDTLAQALEPENPPEAVLSDLEGGEK